jgi:sarcosine oxidase subunit gamma
VAERFGVSVCNVIARKGGEAQLAGRVQRSFGIELPKTPRYAGSSSMSLVWSGPAQWLALCEQNERPQFASYLRSLFSGVASVIEQSGGRTTVRVSGPRAREALAKGVHIDLHPQSFVVGDTAITSVAHIGVQFWQINEIPTYDFSMFRSFAVAFCEWLVEASAEFGVALG